MTIYKKTKVIQKLWGWISLDINLLVFALLMWAEKGEKRFLIYGLIAFFIVLIYCIGKVGSDITTDNLTNGIIVFEYICMFVLCLFGIYKVYDYSTLTKTLIMTAFVIVEILIAIAIPYRFKIVNFFKAKCKNKK
ncbi:MAG: hypothetical protein IKA74_02620 [Clostridia bacterium]|nr:hypothetical protein [Clostridia bacterium]